MHCAKHLICDRVPAFCGGFRRFRRVLGSHGFLRAPQGSEGSREVPRFPSFPKIPSFPRSLEFQRYQRFCYICNLSRFYIPHAYQVFQDPQESQFCNVFNSCSSQGTQQKDHLRGAQETQGRRLEKINISSHSEGLSNFHDYQTSIDTSIALYSVFHINEFLMDHTENHISVQLFHAMLIDLSKNKETDGILAAPI